MNPVQSPGQRHEGVCRTFINVAPQHRIAIQAVYIDLGSENNQTHFNYILVSQKPRGGGLDGQGPICSLEIYIQMQSSIKT